MPDYHTVIVSQTMAFTSRSCLGHAFIMPPAERHCSACLGSSQQGAYLLPTTPIKWIVLIMFRVNRHFVNYLYKYVINYKNQWGCLRSPQGSTIIVSKYDIIILRLTYKYLKNLSQSEWVKFTEISKFQCQVKQSVLIMYKSLKSVPPNRICLFL